MVIESIQDSEGLRMEVERNRSGNDLYRVQELSTVEIIQDPGGL